MPDEARPFKGQKQTLVLDSETGAYKIVPRTDAATLGATRIAGLLYSVPIVFEYDAPTGGYTLVVINA